MPDIATIIFFVLAFLAGRYMFSHVKANGMTP